MHWWESSTVEYAYHHAAAAFQPTCPDHTMTTQVFPHPWNYLVNNPQQNLTKEGRVTHSTAISTECEQTYTHQSLILQGQYSTASRLPYMWHSLKWSHLKFAMVPLSETTGDTHMVPTHNSDKMAKGGKRGLPLESSDGEKQCVSEYRTDTLTLLDGGVVTLSLGKLQGVAAAVRGLAALTILSAGEDTTQLTTNTTPLPHHQQQDTSSSPSYHTTTPPSSAKHITTTPPHHTINQQDTSLQTPPHHTTPPLAGHIM
ncbi:hypothetical protein E2C01_043493 [Portunus trituberculatus]|uniref:Uncharacterized protein n=1 Tax=Portunus trituberculatus TaxID=210409 RepID=A0A5B7FXH1_PORTR|nr:hypothetical protein [Portunus trituberculatus]